MQQYWPFHKSNCKRNEFADAIEETEPKFATWMRRHGKIAVMKDDEVDRLERAGASRQDVMESMYGRVDPKPQGMRILCFIVCPDNILISLCVHPAEPNFSLEERRAMKKREEDEKKMAQRMALVSQSYRQIDIPRDLGIDCGNYKWKQNQSYVEVFIPLSDYVAQEATDPKVSVELQPKRLSVEINERAILRGSLYREIKAEESTWYIQDGVLEIIMLKRSRRGQYANGETNADTFWHAVLESASKMEMLPCVQPPTSYYWSPHEDDQPKVPKRRAIKA